MTAMGPDSEGPEIAPDPHSPNIPESGLPESSVNIPALFEAAQQEAAAEDPPGLELDDDHSQPIRRDNPNEPERHEVLQNNINELVKAEQTADGIDVGPKWYGALKIDPSADAATMFRDFMAAYRLAFPLVRFPDGTMKRFPKQSALDAGAAVTRPGEANISYETVIAQGNTAVPEYNQAGPDQTSAESNVTPLVQRSGNVPETEPPAESAHEGSDATILNFRRRPTTQNHQSPEQEDRAA